MGFWCELFHYNFQTTVSSIVFFVVVYSWFPFSLIHLLFIQLVLAGYKFEYKYNFMNGNVKFRTPFEYQPKI